MALQFQPPQVHQNEFLNQNSIDGIMNAYFRSKQLAMQGQSQDLQNQQSQQAIVQGNRTAAMGKVQDTAQFGKPLEQFSPDQMASAGVASQSGFQGPVQPDVSHLANAMKEFQAQKEAQMQSAALSGEKTRAEIGKTKSEAAINNMFTDSAGGGTGGLDAWSKTLRSDVEAGRKSPSQAQSEASRLGPNGMGRLIVDKALAGLDQTTLEANYHKKTATAGFEGGEGAQKPARLMKSLIPSLDYLGQISKDMGNDNWKVINKYGIKVAAERGDSKAQEMLDASSAISDEFQAMIGGGSNAKLELGMHLFESSKTPEQLARSINFVKQNLNNRSEALLGKEKGTPIKTLEQNQSKGKGGDHSALLDKYGAP